MKLYSTDTKSIRPIHVVDNTVSMYSCGPTVYDFTHIGHLRTYTNIDLLKKSLLYMGYKVNHVMNITDVGHLTGDDDSGEDKLEKKATGSGKSVYEIAQFYTDYFLNSISSLNIMLPNTICKASEHVVDMIKTITVLINKGFTYQTDEAIYFDISKFKNYGVLSCQSLTSKKQKAREEVYVDKQKKHPADFALWFFIKGRFKNHIMYWDSPWGKGFPGWHIECSTMSMKYLKTPLSIHTGGIEHIPVHHENEIAQSESATGRNFVDIWFHCQHLLINKVKMSKSLHNFVTLDDIKKRKINPLALRLLYIQTHYRQIMNFTWQSLESAHNALTNLYSAISSLKSKNDRTQLSEEKLQKVNEYRQRFIDDIQNDLQIPHAFSIVHEVIKSNIPPEDKLDLLYSFDEVFSLGFTSITPFSETIPDKIHSLAQKRKIAKDKGDYTSADTIRLEIQKEGFIIEDNEDGFILKKMHN